MMSDLAESVSTPPKSPATEASEVAVPALSAAGELGPPRSVAGSVIQGPLSLLRFFIRNLLWVVIRIIRALWRHPIITLLMALAIYGAYRGYEEYAVTESPPPALPHFDMVAAIPPANSVLTYLAAQHEFDAEAMWDTYSETTKAANLAQGSTMETLKRATEQLRDQGLRYGGSKYVGGYKLANGLGYYFYVTTVSDDRGRKAEIYQVFMTDPEGKVLRVQAPQLE